MKILNTLFICFFLGGCHTLFSQCSLSMTVTVNNVNGTGNSNGSIVVNTTGGVGDLVYVIDTNGTTYSDHQTASNSHTFSGLWEGTYDIFVKEFDNPFCAVNELSVFVGTNAVSGVLDCSNPVVLSCNTPYDGNTSTGTNNVETYACTSWVEQGPEIVHTFTPTVNGGFGVKLTNYQVNNADKDVYILTSCDPSSCTGQVFSDSAYFANGVAGTTYYIVVDDDNGVAGPYTINVSCENDTNQTDPCDGISVNMGGSDETINGADGTASASVTGVPSGETATYTWSTSDTTSALDSLSAGVYMVTVNITNGCVLTDQIEIFDSSGDPCSGISVVPSATDESSSGAMDGIASVAVSGISADSASFSWDDASTNDSLTGLSAGTYSVTVSFTNGCVINQSVTIGVNNNCNLNLNFVTTDETDTNAANGTITATVSGGSGDYQYFWSNGAPDTNLITALTPGVYTLTATDLSDNCIVTDSVTIFSAANPCALTIQVNALPATGPAETDGAASILVSGGTPPYAYMWNTGSTDAEIFNLTTATYVVTVEDQDGCSEIVPIFVTVVGVDQVIDPLIDQNVRVFPNPTSDLLYLKSSEDLEGVSYQVYSSSGKNVYSNTVQKRTNEAQIDLQNYPKGIYLLKITSPEGAPVWLRVLKQ